MSDPEQADLTRVRLSTGVELEVARSGAPDGAPALFLHGFTDSWFSFSPVLARLPAGIRAIVPSQRGHGDSERPECCYGMRDFARDAAALLDALGIERAAVVGHSMGTFVAQRVAIDHGERVSRLVLIGSGKRGGPEGLIALNEAVQALADPIPTEFVREFQESTAVTRLPAAFLERVVGESMKLPARVWRAALSGQMSSDAEHELHRIQAPTLLISGEHDDLWPSPEQKELWRVISGARLVTIPAAGHATHWDAPARVAAELQSFLLHEPAVRHEPPREVARPR